MTAATTDRCKWITNDPVGAFAAGRGAGLDITTERGTQTYWVRPEILAGRIVAWRLSRPEQDADGLESVVEYTLSGNLWTCGCPASEYRPGLPCKHRRALKAALTKIGFAF